MLLFALHCTSPKTALAAASPVGVPPEARPDGALSVALTGRWLKQSLAGGLGSLINLVTRFYRLLLGTALIGATLAWPRWRPPTRRLLLATLALVVAKTLIGVAGLFLEPRYTLTAVPAIELTLVFCATDLLRRRNQRVER